MTAVPVVRCAHCGTELAPTLYRCPSCGVLAHANRLGEIAADAKRLESEGKVSEALARWNEALVLLPADASQHAAIVRRIEDLSSKLGTAEKKPDAGATGLKGAWIGIVTVAVLVLSKLKFLLLGFTKLGTVLSMLAFLGVYWDLYGWMFALGLVLSIYIHEMGHVASLRHYGIPASAPMFIPGLGAFVRLKAHPPTRGQDARVGLAGPIWGAGAAIASYILFKVTGKPIFAGIAHTGAVLNLFNLLPIWQLDGGRGIQPLARAERILLSVLALAIFAFTHDFWLLALAIGLGIRAGFGEQGEGDRGALMQFAGLLVVLGALVMVRG